MKIHDKTILEICGEAAHVIGLRKPITITWFYDSDLPEDRRLGSSDPIIGINLYKTVAGRQISLNKDFCNQASLEDIIFLITQEICHFKQMGHNNRFQNIWKCAIKYFENKYCIKLKPIKFKNYKKQLTRI